MFGGEHIDTTVQHTLKEANYLNLKTLKGINQSAFQFAGWHSPVIYESEIHSRCSEADSLPTVWQSSDDCIQKLIFGSLQTLLNQFRLI